MPDPAHPLKFKKDQGAKLRSELIAIAFLLAFALGGLDAHLRGYHLQMPRVKAQNKADRT